MTATSNSIPTRSDAALAARDVFFEYFNDVNFYVEDEDQENLYFELLHRLFPKLRIAQIFPLRGKTNVIKHAQDPTNKSRAFRSVYIVDKDFDDLLGRVVEQKNIFYLDKYSIENFILEEESVVQIGVESRPTMQRDAVKAMIAYPTFHAHLVKTLKKLSKLFFAVQKFQLGIKNCDLTPQQFSVTGFHWKLNDAAIAAYEQTVLEKAKAIGAIKQDSELDAFLTTAFPRRRSSDANIPGYYLLAFTYHYLKHKVTIGTVTIDSVRYRLARNCSCLPLKSLGNRIRRYLKTSGIAA
jgi:hypothetical protein